MANKGLKRALNNSKVRCPHCDQGCKWVGELGKVNRHLNANPHPERQFEGCKFTSVKCVHCKDHMRRHVIAGHQNERCPKRPYTCEYCEEYESTFEDVVNHWAECKCYLLPCPNNCNPSGCGIKRQNLEHHMKEECPMTVVECDFHYAGCGVKLPRKDMAGHMREESLVHISLLAAENQRLAKQLLEKDEQMREREEKHKRETIIYLCISQNLADENLAKTRTELEENVTLNSQRLTNDIHKKLGKKVNNTQAVVLAAAVLILGLVLSVAFGFVLYYFHGEHQDLVDRVTQYHRKHQDLVKSVTQHHREHQDLVNSVTQQHHDLVNSVTQHHRKHQDVVDIITRMLSLQTANEKDAQVAPADVKMCGVQLLQYADIPWYTTFYTHIFGYKMYLKVAANGRGDGETTHVSVFTQLIHGEFDSHLDWPFRGTITIQLLSHDDQRYTRTIAYTDATPDEFTGQLQVTTIEIGDEWGRQKFIPHSELEPYLEEDCLNFRILVSDLVCTLEDTCYSSRYSRWWIPIE